jgi:hypothetical protein
MTLSPKWTAISFFTLTTALGVGAFAFAGCTVTSGPIDDDGGPFTNIPPDDDSGAIGIDSSTPVDAGVVCEGNTQSSGDFISPACQQALNNSCCTELKNCFNQVIDPDGGGGPTNDCNVYTECIDQANAITDEQEHETALSECDLGSPQSIIDAYNAIVDCATANTDTSTACQ